MPSEAQKLLPCPFCGGEALHRTTSEHYPASEDGSAGSYDVGHEIGCFAECGFSLGDEYFEDVANAWNTRALAAAEVKPRVKHKKRGTTYEVIGTGKMQAESWIEEKWHREPESGNPPTSTWSRVDMQEVVIYRSESDGSLWVRPVEEFNDGRFDSVDPTPPVLSALEGE